MMAVAMYGAKANSAPVVVMQSDGTQLTVRLFGDEHFSWNETLDGTVLYHEGDNYFVAEIDENGVMASSGILAHEPELRSAKEQQIAGSQNKASFMNHALETMRKGMMKEPIKMTTTTFPHMGSPKVVVILADFADQKFYYDDETTTRIFEQYLNAPGSPSVGNEKIDSLQRLKRNFGSVRKYFSDMSFGQFTPQFDVYGPVHLDQNLVYYGEGEKDRMDRFIPDVCKAADGLIDFSQYDANNDGYVDLVYIIYAGYAASMAGNSTDCIWPKSGNYIHGNYDGKKISRYGVNNELNATPQYAVENGYPLINGIGLFCHEFSHCMGMPDLYPTTSSARLDNQAMENFSVMDGGTYSNVGYRPTAYTAWEREAMGWFEIETLTEAAKIEGLQAVEFGGKAYRIKNPQDESGNEYYVLENIQRGGWNHYLGTTSNYSHGLMITHVNYDANAFTIGSNSVNNTPGAPRMTILPANGKLVSSYKSDNYKETMSANLFPGTTAATDFLYDIEGYPNPVVYNGSVAFMAENAPVKEISENTDEKTISFVFIEDPEPDAIVNAKAKSNTNDGYIYNLAGMRIPADKAKKGLYIMNGKVVLRP